MLELWLRLAYSNLWIALTAGGQVYVMSRILGQSASREAMLLATLAMFWVYTFAKAVHFDPEADQTNDPERTGFLRAYRRPLIGLGVAGLLGGSFLAWRHGGLTLMTFLAPALVGLLYDLKFLPRGFKYRRLKEVPGLKGTSVAFAWTLLTLGLAREYGVRAESQVWLMVSWWSFNVWFLNTTYFDLGDVEGDRLEGTRTLPVLVGFASTRRLLHLLNLAGAVTLTLAVAAGWLAPQAVRLLGIHIGFALLLYRARDESSDISIECDLVADGMFIFAALAFVV